MRVLGIETSSRRGSVALVEDGRLVAHTSYDEPNLHAERVLPQIERLIEQASWKRSELERIAVGVGPGSFTGLRIGIALAQGLALGLRAELVGVGSLVAMAAAVPESQPGARICLLDARRGEVFLAAYDRGGNELIAPCAIARDAVVSALRGQPMRELTATAPEPVVVGEIGSELQGLERLLRSTETDLPHAIWTARLGAGSEPAGAALEPVYVRDAGASLPNLQKSPFVK